MPPRPKNNLDSAIAKKAKEMAQQPPLWTGPGGEGPNGGVTQSLLADFLQCRERFRLRWVEGLTGQGGFNHYLEYGSMWHVCEEELARNPMVVNSKGKWEDALRDYCRKLAADYPMDQKQIDHWYNVCKVQFPVYVRYWAKHKDSKNRQPLLQEQVFDVPYKLPSGRVVRLRGKWDSVDLYKERQPYIRLGENKTKGDIDEEDIIQRLTFDLQTMFYLVALDYWHQQGAIVGEASYEGYPIKGVRYNVVRRPLSGGKYSIRQHKPTKSNPQGESKADFYRRLGELIEENSDYFFMRWTVDVSPGDIRRFQDEFLTPVLEDLCNWYEWIVNHRDNPFAAGNSLHWRHPYGIRNTINGGYATQYDEMLYSGSRQGLGRADHLFGELL